MRAIDQAFVEAEGSMTTLMRRHQAMCKAVVDDGGGRPYTWMDVKFPIDLNDPHVDCRHCGERIQ